MSPKKPAKPKDLLAMLPDTCRRKGDASNEAADYVAAHPETWGEKCEPPKPIKLVGEGPTASELVLMDREAPEIQRIREDGDFPPMDLEMREPEGIGELDTEAEAAPLDVVKEGIRRYILEKHGRKATHPGEVLREEFLVPLGLSVDKLADEIGVAVSVLVGLIAGRSNMTPDLATRLSMRFGTTDKFWLRFGNTHGLDE